MRYPLTGRGLEALEGSTMLGDEGWKENRPVMLWGVGEGHKA